MLFCPRGCISRCGPVTLQQTKTLIQSEETFEGEWVYRIYEPIPEPVKHKRISEMEYNRLRESMQRAAQAYNGFDALFAKLQVNGLVRDWQFHWGNEYKSEFNKMGQ